MTCMYLIEVKLVLGVIIVTGLPIPYLVHCTTKTTAKLLHTFSGTQSNRCAALIDTTKTKFPHT